ncbi:MAG: serine/threonine protein kinase [Deltaproteobacteria bacterium]|nr:serine/threonine protein kinase [Deltaproteobacteria bacterium]
MSEDAKAIPDLPPPPPEEYPRSFGNYLLLAPLARGGMGEVFLAKHGTVAGLEKHCVVKTLRPHLTDDREYTTRFIDEARIVVQLNHRNICHVFDVGVVSERYYLAMDYIAGRDLRTVTSTVSEQGGVLAPGLALHCVCEVLEALDYAHRHADAATGRPLLLVHRDVSPQNVMVSWEGEVKLIDFGLAASSLKIEQTSPNVVMGKLAYMAPEQVRGERVDGRADQFAVAVMLYEVLVGERFYEGRSPYEIWGLAAQGGYRPRGWDVLDAEVRAILERALAATPGGRYDTCLEMREALQAYRYARGLHGDSPMLRALMQKVFAPDIDESKKTMALLSAARPKVAVAGVVALGMESTMSIARAPSLPNARSPDIPVVREPTEPTQQMLKQLAGQQQRAPVLVVAAVIALVGAVVGVVVARQLGGPAEDPDQYADVTNAGSALPLVPSVDAGTALQMDAGVAGVAPLVDGGSVAAGPPDDPADKNTRDKRNGKRATPKRPPPPEPAPPDPVVAPPPSPVVGRAWGELGWPARVDELARRCANQPCAAAVAEHRGDYGEIAPELLIQWKAAVHACWERCGLPE